MANSIQGAVFATNQARVKEKQTFLAPWVRADSGHYVLLPSSIHPDGSAYKWLNPLLKERGLVPRLPPSLARRSGTGDPAIQQPMQPIACVPQAAVDAIEATLPTGPGQRNRRVFDLARRLKGIGGLDTSPAMLKTIVGEWYRRALPVITTKEFGETWSDFQIAWQRVEKPYAPTVHAAFESARRTPAQYFDDNLGLGILAAFCRNLSEGSDGNHFYLSCRTVEGLFGVSRVTAWRWLRALQFYGVIELVKKGKLTDRRASTWRFIRCG